MTVFLWQHMKSSLSPSPPWNFKVDQESENVCPLYIFISLDVVEKIRMHRKNQSNKILLLVQSTTFPTSFLCESSIEYV